MGKSASKSGIAGVGITKASAEKEKNHE